MKHGTNKLSLVELPSKAAAATPHHAYNRHPNLLARCKAVTGHWPSAAILHALLNRFLKKEALLTQPDGYWLVQPGRCWRQEAGCGEREYKTAMKRLKTLALIETTLRPLSSAGVLRTTFMRPTNKALELLGPDTKYQLTFTLGKTFEPDSH